MSELDEYTDNNKDSSHDHVRALYAVGVRRAIGIELCRAHRSNLGRRVFRSTENKGSTNKGRKHGTDSVESLGKIQPALRTCRRAKNRDVRIRGNLQEALATSHYEQREKEEFIEARRGSGNKKQCTDGTERQARQNAFLVTDSFHHAARGKSRQEITSKERNLNKRRMKIS